MQKSSTVLPRLPTLPDCKSAAPLKQGMGQLWAPPHTALLFTALPAQFQHWWSACYRKILYLTRHFTAAISMVPRTLLATRHFTVQPGPGQIPTLSEQHQPEPVYSRSELLIGPEDIIYLSHFPREYQTDVFWQAIKYFRANQNHCKNIVTNRNGSAHKWNQKKQRGNGKIFSFHNCQLKAAGKRSYFLLAC